MMKKRSGQQPANIDRETWRDIVKAAKELFLARGYKGVSMRDVAEVVQITPAALYYYFPQGKEDLFISMMQVTFEEWTAGIYQAIAGAQGIRERLHLLTSYLLTLPVDNFPALIRDAHEQIKNNEKRHAIFRQLRSTFEQHVADVFQQAIDAGEITADIPASVLASMYQGMVIALLQYLHFSTKDVERIAVPRLVSIVVSTLLDGIASPVQQTSP
jgi:AcrR family transcriptional regulator